MFAKAYGLEQAKKLLCGGLFHYTPTGASRFQKQGRYFARGEKAPKPGDVVFFYSKAKGRIGHTGIVYRVDGGKVYTIEGNTSGANTLVTNGGGVKKKSYKLTDACIHGYGRPAYEDTQEELNLRVLKNGSRGADVKALQILLMGYGEDCGACGADGVFGSATGKAVKAYQSKNGLAADSIAGEKTWRKLLGVTA